MIKETTTKIHFLPYNPIRGRVKDINDTPTLNLNTALGRLQFSRYAVEQMKMKDRFIRFYFDPVKKIIGWKISDKIENQNELKLWKFCKAHNNGLWTVSLKRMLEQFQNSESLAGSYRGLPVFKYRDQSLMGDAGVYYYVKLSPEYRVDSDTK